MYTLLGVIVLAILTVAILVVMAVGGFVGNIDEGGNGPSGEKIDWGSFTVTATDTLRGDLVLVNNAHAYTFPATNEHLAVIFNIWKPDPKAPSHPYVLSGLSTYMDQDALLALDKMLVDFATATGRTNVQLRHAYRTYEEQEGKDIQPGYSDHHTGLGCVLKLVTEEPMEGEHEFETPMMVKYHDLSEDAACKWLTDNCHKYGFVVRYPADKAAVTGVSDYTDYFRYVGIPHAAYMTENNLCLEEYVELVKGYTSASPLQVTVSDVSYQIFFADISESSTVYYPAYHTCVWSGVGKDGVILTLTK